MEEAECRGLNQLVERLQAQKNQLEIELSQHSAACFVYPKLINAFHSTGADNPMIFGDLNFLSFDAQNSRSADFAARFDRFAKRRERTE